VKPAPFTYHRPASRPEVDELLARYQGDAKILAGGQSLVPLLNLRLVTPEHVIDVNGVARRARRAGREGGAS
jgi:carbon-monoxide dehydrogenase medium subunit